MKEIKLSNGMAVIVDDADYEWLNRWKWYADKSRTTCYARRDVNRRYVKMCRLIMACVFGDGQFIDHINGNGLDNRRRNLRICTNQQNQHNQKPRLGSSVFKGVHFHKNSNYWIARIRVNGIRIYLGCSKDEIEAAKMYDMGAIKYFKEYARLNFFKAEGK